MTASTFEAPPLTELLDHPDLANLDQGHTEREQEFVEFADVQIENEVYAHSLRTIRRWGSFLLREEFEAPEALDLKEFVSDDFNTKLVEMLKTDTEFRERLDVETKKPFTVKDRKTCAPDGTPFVDMLTDGLESAKEAARKDPKLQPEVERAEGDLEVIGIVDGLAPGESYMTISLDPKHELKRHKKLYEDRGYRSGIAYVQWYSKEDNDTLVAGSYSVDLSDEERWRSVGAGYGLNIPQDESPNRFIRHGTKFEGTPEQTQDRVRQMREDYYQLSGASGKRYSVNEFVAAHRVTVDRIFDVYYPKLAQAVVSGENNEILQGLAFEAVQHPPSGMKPELIDQLRQVATTDQLDDDLNRTLDTMISYAAVEELRTHLKRLVGGESLKTLAYEAVIRQQEYAAMPLDMQNSMMSQSMVANIRRGVDAGRSYGGCTPSNLSKSDKSDSSDDSFNPMDIFGGLSEQDSSSDKEEEKVEEDEYGPLVFKCTAGCENRRPRGKLITECKNREKGCKGSVGC